MLELWLLIALIILIAAVYKPLTRTIFGALDGHTEKVRHELDEAKRLREEAQHMLAEHQRQLEGGQDQAKAIVEHARLEAERQSDRQRAELEAMLKRRADQAVGRIAQQEARAVQDVRAHASRLVVRTTERLLRDQIDTANATALVDGAIDEVGRKIS